MSGIYLHIPFCKQACSYCDFYFVTRQHQQQEFVEALIREIRSYKNTRFTEETVKTIYFGGGTPSLLSTHQFELILVAIDEVFELKLEESTVELNPDDVTPDFLSDLKSLGINRASMGVQSFDEQLLASMHRAHNSSEALQCLEYLSKSGFNSFTVDLIYGNPNQTLKMLENDLRILSRFEPPHVSAYSLTIEEGTRLGKQVQLGRINPPEDEEVANHFDLVRNKLGEMGIEQYEVSNFAKPGKEALHNSAYWSHANYLGLGPSAHSFWWDVSKQSASRWSNKKELTSYLKKEWQHQDSKEILKLSQLAEERLMLALRTRKGISLMELKEKYEFTLSHAQLAYLAKKQKEGVIETDGSVIKLSRQGLLIADLIILDLITA